MSLKLNRLSVPADLQEDVEKIALDRFPDNSVTWVDDQPGFILLDIPKADHGSAHDIDADGRPVGAHESGREAVMEALEERLQRFVRSKHQD
jgi:hypothetical protein